MPNWVDNRLTITGDKTQLDKLKKDAVLVYEKVEKGEEKDNKFSIAKLVPLPEELRETTSPPDIVSEKEYPKALAKWRVEKIKVKKKKSGYVVGMPITKKISDELIKKYGTNNWYDWQVRNWGTKWDTRTLSMNTDTEKRLDYDIDTAWSPPCGALVKISQDYPKLTFKLKYCEPSMCFMGDYHVKNGKVIMNNQLDGVWAEYEHHHDIDKETGECVECGEKIK
mgnify:CR=1 FL=1